MLRTRTVGLLICLLALTAGIACSDVITDWNSIALETLKSAPISPPMGSRALAMVHVAMFDAVNSVDRLYDPYFVQVNVTNPISREAAAATAGYRVLVGLFPARTLELNAELASWLGRIPNGDAKARGIELGDYVGNQILQLRSNDGAHAVVPYVPEVIPGHWRPTPPGYLPALLPNWAYVTPFAMESCSQFRPAGPPSMMSPEYVASFIDVMQLGELNSPWRTTDETRIAYFWADDGGFTPAGRWNIVAQELVGNSGPITERARMFAMLNIAEADAAIVAWDCKYAMNFWRPITAIREADTDGNPLTVAIPGWTPLLVTPNFPENISGHSTFAGAASTILQLILGTDRVRFTLDSTSPKALPRSYRSLSQAANEDGRSRIYGGIHFQFSNEQALEAGSNLANYVWGKCMQPKWYSWQR